VKANSFAVLPWPMTLMKAPEVTGGVVTIAPGVSPIQSTYGSVPAVRSAGKVVPSSRTLPSRSILVHRHHWQRPKHISQFAP